MMMLKTTPYDLIKSLLRETELLDDTDDDILNIDSLLVYYIISIQIQQSNMIRLINLLVAIWWTEWLRKNW